MVNRTIRKIELTENETSTVCKAFTLISQISNAVEEAASLDDQVLPQEVEDLIKLVLSLENKKKRSVFNILTDDARARLEKELSME